MPKTTLGTLMLNENLPSKYRIRPGETINKKRLKSMLVQIAREDPNGYPDIVQNLKRLGDNFSTLEPYSPGLDDLESPAGMTALLNRIDQSVKAAPTYERKAALLQAGQEQASALSMKSTGNLASHVNSGGRGNAIQLMRMIASPVATGGAKRGVSPLTIKRSFSQGLNAGEYYAAAMEARQNTVDTFTQVQKPGAVNKTLTSNLNSLIITERDCGTRNGIMMDISDSHVIDRFTASNTPNFQRNTLIDTPFLRKLAASDINSIKARSPMTCAARDGVCAYCQGLLENKQLGEIGTNVGVRSAQAMSEPLVQMALDSKHAAKLTSASGMRGLAGFEQLTNVPKNFLNKAIVAKTSGFVTRVETAPQGGMYVDVDKKEHYVEPGFKVFVRPGDKVESGDVMSEGVPSPKEIVDYKGLGSGRMHYVKALHQVYKNSGVDLDRRHLENLAKQTLNYVKINKSKPELDMYAGEIHSYNKLRDAARDNSTEMSVDSAVGKYLGDEYLHYTSGTKILPSIASDLKRNGITKVLVSNEAGFISPIMRSSEQTPLMNPDLLAKMGFRYLKKSFIEGVQQGAKSNIHGTSPWPAYMYGKEFGEGNQGKY